MLSLENEQVSINCIAQHVTVLFWYSLDFILPTSEYWSMPEAPSILFATVLPSFTDFIKISTQAVAQFSLTK